MITPASPMMITPASPIVSAAPAAQAADAAIDVIDLCRSFGSRPVVRSLPLTPTILLVT